MDTGRECHCIFTQVVIWCYMTMIHSLRMHGTKLYVYVYMYTYIPVNTIYKHLFTIVQWYTYRMEKGYTEISTKSGPRDPYKSYVLLRVSPSAKWNCIAISSRLVAACSRHFLTSLYLLVSWIHSVCWYVQQLNSSKVHPFLFLGGQQETQPQMFIFG